jgi:ASC-1-like (ASCH) protein
MKHGELNQEDINALLRGEEVMDDNVIVITSYGRGKKTSRFKINIFSAAEESRDLGEKNAAIYCKTVNNLELKDDNWVFARIVCENKLVDVQELRNYSAFNEMIPILDDRAIQKMLRELPSMEITLAKALKDSTEEAGQKIFRNMSKRAATILREDMEYMGPVRLKDVREAQEEIVKIVGHLEDSGEIVIEREEDEILEPVQ